MLSTPARQPDPSAAHTIARDYPDVPRRGIFRSLRTIAKLLLTDRISRIRVILAIVIILSLVDLDMTLVYAKYTGMVEQNPIAREMMSRGAVGLLILWKFVTVGIAVGLLYGVRKYRTGELGAWLCLAVMCWLTARWFHYNEEISVLQAAVISPIVQDDPRFVMIPETVD